MTYRYLKNLRDQKAIKETDLSKLKKKKPTFKSKGEYRDWCVDPSTDHCFYSTVEGDNPSARVTAENPPNTISGVVGDYDAPVDWANVVNLLKAQCKEYTPTWISRTQSGYIRVVFESSKKIPISPDMFDAFMKRICVQLSMERILAGFDRSSLKATQYFELGEDWVKIGDPLPASVFQTALLKAASDTPPQSKETSIPIDVVAAEVAKRFPNRGEGDFAVGARGPLFWIDDGIDREGCQVVEEGIVCYSERAGNGFISWKDLFGPKFVDAYETQKMGNLLDQYWFNGKTYFKLIYGNAAVIPRDQVVLELRKAGFSPRPKKGHCLSEVETAILAICNENRIDEIAPVIWADPKDRVVLYNGRRILNDSSLKPIEPADDGDPSFWPFIDNWLSNMFANEGKRKTLHYFYAWLRRFYNSVLIREAAQGQALLLVGPTNRGKSLLSNRVIAPLVGGYADASDYLSGQTQFNKDLAKSAAWLVDDTVSAASFQDQRRATELIKRTVANPRMEYHAKYVDAINIPWSGRVVMSLNMDPNSLSVIPSLDSSNRDKLIALRLKRKSSIKFPSNAEVERTIAKELPHFARWLLDWEVPKNVVGDSRFGVVSYIDQQISSAAYDNSSRSSIAELVEFFAKRAREYFSNPVWRGTLTEFQVAIHEFNNGRNVGMSGNPEFVRRGMQVLEEASKTSKQVRPIKSLGFGGGKIWEINLDAKYDIDNVCGATQNIISVA